MEKSFNILKASNEHIKWLIEKIEDKFGGKESHIIKEEKEKNPDEGPGKRTRTRSEKNKEEEAPTNIQKIKEATEKLELLGSNAATMLRNLS